jgi:proton-coupled amino acid transporter
VSDSAKKNTKYHLDTLIRILIVIATVVIGIFSIGRFDTLLALVGSAACCPIALIFPCLFHYLLFKEEIGKVRTFFDLSIFVLGIILSLAVLIFTIFPL